MVSNASDIPGMQRKRGCVSRTQGQAIPAVASWTLSSGRDCTHGRSRKRIAHRSAFPRPYQCRPACRVRADGGRSGGGCLLGLLPGFVSLRRAVVPATGRLVPGGQRSFAHPRPAVGAALPMGFVRSGLRAKHLARPGRPVAGHSLSRRDGRTAGKEPADTRPPPGGHPPGTPTEEDT